MSSSETQRSCLVIRNQLGFHMRPVQRFAELSRVFNCDVDVEIDGKKAPGKSVVRLVTLGGQCGSRMRIRTRGEDARQALHLLSYLVERNFFVEDDPSTEIRPQRHIERLMRFASCFESKVWVRLKSQKANAKNRDALREMALEPGSDVQFEVKGRDADQAQEALNLLKSYKFYVEEELGADSPGETG